ncbi:hypothetical protein [Paenibacillus daejeonensis]|uniref:hypothetical protein n=1 Tax=Paenibacillus daejeonensis TaxID=135193 RepID=UPI000374C657|nr:hypothetical protein [Paenibacillus daejeonensis]
MGVLYEIIRRATKRSDSKGSGQERTMEAGTAEALLRLSNRQAELELRHQYGRENVGALRLQRKPEV